MKYLADESLEYPLISFLRENKIDIIAVRDIMRGSTDAEILAFAFNNNLIIITSDKDFGELTFRLKRPNCGIILLRLNEVENSSKGNLLLNAIMKLSPDIKNKFIVIDKVKIRIRSSF
jgi:predicted nuclease of predicted toxin-antitoxin system